MPALNCWGIFSSQNLATGQNMHFDFFGGNFTIIGKKVM